MKNGPIYSRAHIICVAACDMSVYKGVTLHLNVSLHPAGSTHLGRAAHHQLDEVPAAALGSAAVPKRVQPLQGAVLREPAAQHGPLARLGDPTSASPLRLTLVSRRGVQVVAPDRRGGLAPSPLPHLDLCPREGGGGGGGRGPRGDPAGDDRDVGCRVFIVHLMHRGGLWG